jgi:hypothetical protein
MQAMTIYRLALALAILLVGSADLRADLIFDSFTGPDVGGFTSATVGGGTRISVSQDVTITNIAVLNRMPTAGQLIFFVINPLDRTVLFQTPPSLFGPDSGTTLTWKTSSDFTFLLGQGRGYVIGSISDVSRFDAADTIAESQNGITSDLELWAVFGFPTITSARPFFIGEDAAIRLFGVLAVPEPSSLLLASIGLLGLLTVRRQTRLALGWKSCQ